MFYVLSYIWHTDPQFDTLEEAIERAKGCSDPDVEVYRLTDDNQIDVLWPPIGGF